MKFSSKQSLLAGLFSRLTNRTSSDMVISEIGITISSSNVKQPLSHLPNLVKLTSMLIKPWLKSKLTWYC